MKSWIISLWLVLLCSATHAQSIHWKARWLQVGYNEDTVNRPAQYFSKVFSLKGEIKSASLLITAHGLYDASMNDNRVGDDYFTPGFTAYQKRLQYQNYDVTHLLRQKDNHLTVTLASGWYRGQIDWMGNKNFFGSTLALLCQLEVVYTDGRKATIVSDESWKCSEGPVRAAEIMNGETYDATKNPDFDRPVRVAEYGFGNLVLNEGVPVCKHETFTPKLIITPRGEEVLDFGQNLAGWVMFKAHGLKGDTISLGHGEVLDPKGNFYMDNMRSAKTIYKGILSGEAEEHFEPHFTYFGFRYVRVSGVRGRLNPSDFTAVAVYAGMKPTGSFECSDSLLNQLHHNIVWGQKSNFMDVPTDCPQRDEKLGWTGDAQAFCRTASFNFDVRTFFSKWLNDLAADQLPSGMIPHVVPDVVPELKGSAGWGDAATIIPWTMYEVYGDRELLARQYPSMKAFVGYMHSQAKDDLWNTGIHYGDWLSYRSTTNREYTAHTDMYLIAQAFYAHSTELLLKSAKVLGKTDDIRIYSELLNKIKAAFCAEYVTPWGMVSSNTQTAYTLALQFDLLPENMRAGAAKRLVDNIRFYNDHITTGFIGTPYICHVLSRFGYSDVAYRLLLQKTYPGWLYPVTKGATTIWERWDGIRPDGSLQNPEMNSFNHYAYGAIGDWMYRVMAGIDNAPGEIGYKKIRIRPHPGGGLTWCKASYDSVQGKISVSWKIKGDQFLLDVEIPEGCTAEVFLPGSKQPLYVKPGKHHWIK
ncbi:family 78 glycoside hydrolase catalytic domain [Pararcticibacter amylolyticus]|uniref:alpha-L-rhamnosidase n=1 Tax=Pararcticibacter amylolyticus TaxID=2173175 RepID=A0A2U2PI47_9SPHI|nr:family 78 glycoside hydrolase catalytic domain [Pararcticibacter amylolyticus]PWG80819.1 alpha-L-rhamnosidase [Pararcticibacter amylolyticus]